MQCVYNNGELLASSMQCVQDDEKGLEIGSLCHQRFRCIMFQAVGIAAMHHVEPSFAEHVSTHRRRNKIPVKIPAAQIIDIRTNC